MARSARGASPKQRAHRGATTGRYMTAEQRGRYTRPVPKETRRSPRWFGVTVLLLLLAGVLLLVGDYLQFLPGATNSGYLIAGVLCMLAGFLMATRLH